MSSRLILSGLAGALLLASCASDPVLVGRPNLRIVDQQTELPPPATVDLIAEPRAYVIGPLDRLSVDVYGVPELSRSVQVDASGRIAMPLVGSIEASGKTPETLGAQIAAQLRNRYVRNPQVTVNLSETVSQVVTVEGSVRTPGLYAVTGRMTLIRAIARAEGTSEFAREDHVVVFRRVNGKDMAALYDLRAIRQGIYPDPEIYANDIVMVGESSARRIFRDLVSVSPLLAAPLVAILN
jgi:polysaccharide export outer membrane protein